MASADERAKKVEAAKLKLKRFQASKVGNGEPRRSIDGGHRTPTAEPSSEDKSPKASILLSGSPTMEHGGEITSHRASFSPSRTGAPASPTAFVNTASLPTTLRKEGNGSVASETHATAKFDTDAKNEGKFRIEIESLQAALKKSEEEKGGLRAELERETSHRSSQAEENHMLHAEVKLLKAELSAQHSAAEMQQVELRNSRSRLIEKDEEVAALLQELSSMQGIAEDKSQRVQIDEGLTAEKQRVFELQTEMQDINLRLMEAGELLAQRDASISALREECELLRSRVSTLEADKQGLENETITLRSAIDEAEKEKAATARAELELEKAVLPSVRPSSAFSTRNEHRQATSTAASVRTHSPNPSEGTQPAEASEQVKGLLHKLAKLQQDYATSQAELERLRLSQADIGTLLLRTGSSPTFAESLATYQRRCDELAALVQSLQTERDQLKAEVERLKIVAWETERAEARASEMSGELGSLRESIERERELWKGREEMMKNELSSTRSDNNVCVQLLDTLWGLLRDEFTSSSEDSTTAPETPTAHRAPQITKAWRNGALEKAVNNLFEKVKDLKLAVAEAHVVMDKQHDKIEQLISERTVDSAINNNSSPNRQPSFTHQNANAQHLVEGAAKQDMGTQTHPMLAYARLETIKARLAEAGVIWTYPAANRAAIHDQSDHTRTSPASIATTGTSTQPLEDLSSQVIILEKRLGSLAMSHAQLQTAHEAAQAHIASLEQRLGHAKKLVVALSTGDIQQAGDDGEDAGEGSEDRLRLMTTLVAQLAQFRDLEADLATWRTRCEELEEIVEEWSLGSAGGPSQTVGSPQSS